MLTSKIFTDTYVWQKDPRHSFLILAAGSVDVKPEYLDPSQRDHSKFRKASIDSVEHHTLSISLKYAKCLTNALYPCHLYHLLKQKLTDEGIKALYPKLWIDDHNAKTLKKNRAEFAEMRHLKNIGKLPIVDRCVSRITKGVSLREAAKWSI